MDYFLLGRKNRTAQYRKTRRTDRNGGRLTGLIVLHDAENATDLIGADGGAEAVAAWIRDSRPDYGSYHELVDRDSYVPMAPYTYEVWHDTASNNFSVGLSVAWRKADLPKMTRAQRNQYYLMLAQSVMRAVRWFKKHMNIVVPLDRFLSRTEAMAYKPGITTHSRMDPSRRSDPFGTGSVYEREFLEILAREAKGETEDDMPLSKEERELLEEARDAARWAKAALGGTNRKDAKGNRIDPSARSDLSTLLSRTAKTHRDVGTGLANQALMAEALKTLIENTAELDGERIYEILDRRLGEAVEHVKVTIQVPIEEPEEDDPVDEVENS